MKKRIGITFSHYHWPDDELNHERMRLYMAGIENAGGIAEPLWLPCDGDPDDKHAAHLAQQFDGLMLSGGADLPPSFYGEEQNPNAHVKVVPLARPAFESALLREFLHRDKSVFGICYGCQFFNVWRGGTLIQDIPLQWPKPIEHHSGRHPVRVLHNTLLHRIVGMEEFEVVTSHHQAIHYLAKGAETSAFAPDRLAEAIEFDDKPFFLGVQWHPERDPESEATQRLFDAFVKACGGVAK
jgi:putative glutamine amidotransferase